MVQFCGFRPEVTAKMLARSLMKPKVRFAFLPRRLHNGKWIWLERYRLVAIGVWLHNGTLHQYRVGGSSMDGEGGQYFPRRRFAMDDNSYFTVDYFDGNDVVLKNYLNRVGEMV